MRLALVALLTFAAPIASVRPAVAAQLHHAAVVVHHGNGGVTYSYVPFTEDEIDGAELLRRAGLDAVTVSFGGLGEGVCMIEQEGCPPSVCRTKLCQDGAADSPFWHFFQLDSGGAWRLSALGASSAEIHDGDVSGWSWSGSSALSPAVTFAQMQSLAARNGAASGAPIVWRIGPAPEPGPSGQSWDTYAGAALILFVALAGLGFFFMRRRRPLAPRSSSGG